MQNGAQIKRIVGSESAQRDACSFQRNTCREEPLQHFKGRGWKPRCGQIFFLDQAASNLGRRAARSRGNTGFQHFGFKHACEPGLITFGDKPGKLFGQWIVALFTCQLGEGCFHGVFIAESTQQFLAPALWQTKRF
ncbi:hypothetical protein D3C80_1536400 [compost metagenome]